jgi:hypothetical protein
MNQLFSKEDVALTIELCPCCFTPFESKIEFHGGEYPLVMFVHQSKPKRGCFIEDVPGMITTIAAYTLATEVKLGGNR